LKEALDGFVQFRGLKKRIVIVILQEYEQSFGSQYHDNIASFGFFVRLFWLCLERPQIPINLGALPLSLF